MKLVKSDAGIFVEIDKFRETISASAYMRARDDVDGIRGTISPPTVQGTIYIKSLTLMVCQNTKQEVRSR